METMELIQTIAFFVIGAVILTITALIAVGKKINPKAGWWHRDNVRDLAKWAFIALFVSALIGGAIYHFN